MSRKLTLTMLKERLRTRERAKDEVYYLDLRHEDFGMLGRVTLHDPRHPKWPKKGRTTADEAEAKRWLEEKYLSHVRTQVALKSGGSSGPATMTEACNQFIADLGEKLGQDHNTVSNWRSVCNVHIKPAFGDLPPTVALEAERVGPFLENLQVEKRRHGNRWKEPAGIATKRNVRAMLQSLWRHFYKHEPPPFGAIRLRDDARKALIRQAVERGELFLQEAPDTYSPAEVLEILAHAMVYDRVFITSMPNIAVRVIPNTAEVIALQLGFATRIDELMPLRFGQVLDKDRIVRIPGMKNDNAWRWAPIQDCVVPWLARLRLHAGEPAPDDYVIRTDPRARGRGRRPSKKTYQARISRVLTRAGLKYDQKLTHIFRATHITWAAGNGYPDDRLQWWVGHSNPKEGVTGIYKDPNRLARILTERDRTYLVGLPTPEECEERAREILRGRK